MVEMEQALMALQATVDVVRNLVENLGVTVAGHSEQLRQASEQVAQVSSAATNHTSQLQQASERVTQLENSVQHHAGWLKTLQEDTHEMQKHLFLLKEAKTSSGGGFAPSRSKDNLTNRKDAKDLKRYIGGDQDFTLWKAELELFLDMNDLAARAVLKWAEETKRDNITEGELGEWADSEQDLTKAEAFEAMEQLYFLLVFRTDGTPKDLVMNLSKAGKMRGALAWNHVNEAAVGLTANRMAHLTNRCTNPTRVKAVDDVPAALAAWERDMRELDRAPGYELNEQQKMLSVRALVPEAMAENLLNFAEQFDTYAKLRRFIDHQVALRRSGKGAKPSSVAPKSQPPRSDAMEMHLNSGEWMNYGSRATGDEEADAPSVDNEGEQLYVMKGSGKTRGFPINGACGYCQAWGHMKRDCPVLDQVMASRRKGAAAKGDQKGQKGYGKGFKGFGEQLIKGAGKGRGSYYKGAPSQGQWHQKGSIGSYASSGYKGGAKGISELHVGGDPWGEVDIPGAGEDSNWIFATYAGGVNPTKTLNQFMVLQEDDEDAEEDQSEGHNAMHEEEQGAKAMKPAGVQDAEVPSPLSCSTSMSGSCLSSSRPCCAGAGLDWRTARQPPMAMDSWPSLAPGPTAKRAKKSRMPRTSRWRASEIKVGLQAKPQTQQQYEQLLAEEQHAPGQVGDVPEFAALTYLGPSEINEEAYIHHVHNASEAWEEVCAVMDSGAVDFVAPPSIASELPVLESLGSRSGQKYFTADGTRIPNQGQKKFTSFTEEGRPVETTYQIAEVSRPLQSVGRICDNNKAVVFGASGGYILDLATNEKVAFCREQGVYMMRTWVPVGTQAGSSFGRQG